MPSHVFYTQYAAASFIPMINNWWHQHAMALRRRLQASKQGRKQWLSSDGNDTEPSETLNNVQGDIITLV